MKNIKLINVQLNNRHHVWSENHPYVLVVH